MKQSLELTEFYTAYQAWLDAGAPSKNNFGFVRSHGLCGNLVKYCGNEMPLERELCDEMLQQFREARLHVVYPFNDFLQPSYESEHLAHTCHGNTLRIEWVRGHAKPCEQ